MDKIEEMISRSIEQGMITQEKHDKIIEIIQSDGEIDEHESEQLSRLFSALDSGKLKIVDDDSVTEELEIKEEEQQKQKALEQEQERQLRLNAQVGEILDSAIACGELSQDEHDLIMTKIHADGQIDENEKEQLSRLFAALQSGALKITESDRQDIREKAGIRELETAKKDAVAQDEQREELRIKEERKEIPITQAVEEDSSECLDQEASQLFKKPDEQSSIPSQSNDTSQHSPEKASETSPDSSTANELFSAFSSSTQSRRTNGSPFELRTDRLLDVALMGKVWIKTGAMVGYYGSIKFTREGFFEHGISKFIKKSLTGEGAPLTKASGQGNLFLADQGKKISIIELSGHTLVVNGKNLLAFEETANWDITYLRQIAAVWAGGFFNVRLSGKGMTAITTHYDPIILRVSPTEPVMTDINATVAWSGTLNPQFKTDVSMRTLVGRASGETIQMRFEGDGFVVIQPYEESFDDREDSKDKKSSGN